MLGRPRGPHWPCHTPPQEAYTVQFHGVYVSFCVYVTCIYIYIYIYMLVGVFIVCLYELCRYVGLFVCLFIGMSFVCETFRHT